MGNWNTGDSYDDYNADRFDSPTTDSGNDEAIAFISPTTGRVSTGNWNIGQAKANRVQSAVIDGRTIYGSNAALAALGDPSSQVRENVIAGYPAYIANKRAEQRFMDNWIGTDLSTKIGRAADAAGIPRSEIPFLSEGKGFDEAGFEDQEGSAITFSAGTGDRIGLKDERSFGEKVGDFFTNAFEGKPERDFVVGTEVDPVTGLTTYTPAYQVVNENNLMDALASRVSPFFSIDSKRLQDPVSRKYYSYSDVDLPFGLDKVAGIMQPTIEDEQVRKARQREQMLAQSVADAQSGSTIAAQTPEKFLPYERRQSLVPTGRDQYGGFILPFFGTGFNLGAPSFYTSGLPSLQGSFSLLR